MKQILVLAVLFSCHKVAISKAEIGAVGKVLEFYEVKSTVPLDLKPR